MAMVGAAEGMTGRALVHHFRGGGRYRIALLYGQIAPVVHSAPATRQ